VVAHRGDLRWPLPKDFAKRLEGQTVTGLGKIFRQRPAQIAAMRHHFDEAGAFHDGRKAAADGFDFGQFRHG